MNTLNFRQLGGAILLGTIAVLSPLAVAETVITETAGTIDTFSPDSLVIRSEVASAPTRYVVSRDVAYVDEAGAPVSIEVVKSGVPVTVHYVREADRVVARRVVVRRTAAVRPAPVVEERVVVKPAPPVVQERVRVVTPAPVVQERRTVVTPAPAPIVEERTTTTTTTTRKKD